MNHSGKPRIVYIKKPEKLALLFSGLAKISISNWKQFEKVWSKYILSLGPNFQSQY